ncbi:MAG: hypothetical protein ACKOTA_10685, partial [Solirubrobacterales bacterium]
GVLELLGQLLGGGARGVDEDVDPVHLLDQQLQDATADQFLNLAMISNRGIMVWPEGHAETSCVDHWRCRFLADTSGAAHRRHVVETLRVLNDAGVDFVKTEGLYRFDGEPGYSLGQGQ